MRVRRIQASSTLRLGSQMCPTRLVDNLSTQLTRCQIFVNLSRTTRVTQLDKRLVLMNSQCTLSTVRVDTNSLWLLSMVRVGQEKNSHHQPLHSLDTRARVPYAVMSQSIPLPNQPGPSQPSLSPRILRRPRNSKSGLWSP